MRWCGSGARPARSGLEVVVLFASLGRWWCFVEEVLAPGPHHEDAWDSNPGLGGGCLFRRRKWLAGFAARLPDPFPSSSPGCESGDIVAGENRVDFVLGGDGDV
jgi:hypothetical protein